MGALILTREEVRELTGSAQRALQRQHLNALGIPYRVNAQGWPVVLRDAAVKSLGGDAANDGRDNDDATLDMRFLDS
ncbi:DUF4224 domain-containing protein [Halomonas sabkhae]|uniref:DUF4224 domain-containing protein n=1 Tax=Halomonas sabkhae TaxID=626223 RepID=UPI0025B5738F|nr:DUF4224 domain-containing protein [Halomonas sabkhae]MDN3525681.1 DUF4224 domain-containing protein [Halomonas sabkhae]